jgi:hypothetical protein
LTLGTDGNYFDITGTTAITSISTLSVGTIVKLHFDDVLTLTYNATDLILPGGANITTAAGDEAEFVEYATGDWRCISYTRASGTSVVPPAGITISAAVATTSGTAWDFTGISSGVKRIALNFDQVSTDGTSFYTLQIGDSGGLETTGYDSGSGQFTSTTQSTGTGTTYFTIQNPTVAASAQSGTLFLTLIDEANNLWELSGTMWATTNNTMVICAGRKALSSTLTQLRVSTVSADTGDGGQLVITTE